MALIATCLSTLSWAYTPVVDLSADTVVFSESIGEALLFTDISVSNEDENSTAVNVQAVVTIMNPVWGFDALAANNTNAAVTSGDEANGIKPAVTLS